MYELRTRGLEKKLPELLESRILVGNSAGSIAMTKNLSLTNPKHKKALPEQASYLSNEAVGFFPFLLRPHYNTPGHPSSEADVEKLIDEYGVTEPVYMIDDETAVVINGTDVHIVSEGEWKILNQ